MHTFSDVHTYYTGYLWHDEDLVLDEAKIDQESMVYPPHSSSSHHLHYANVHYSHYCCCIHPSWWSSTWPRVYYNTQSWVYGVRISTFTSSPAHPLAHSISIFAPNSRRWEYTSPVPSSTPSLPPASLVRRITGPHRLPPHKAPWTSAWSSNMKASPGKYFRIKIYYEFLIVILNLINRYLI